MANEAIRYNYSGRDFTARYEALLALLGNECPELTDRNHSDAGISQIRLTADTGDKIGFYLDEAFDESFIETAKFKQSLIDIGKTVDVLPKLASSATTTVVITRAEDHPEEITIPRFAEFTRSDGLKYLATEDVTLPVGHTSVSVEVQQGELVTLTLDPKNFAISLFTNRAMFNLGTNVAARSIEMTHGTDPIITWTEQESFWRSLATDNHFVPELYAEPVNGVQDTVYLVLGDGTYGMQLPDSDATVTFIRTDGPDGNTGASTITVAPTGFTSLITVTNPTPATGGALAERTNDYRWRIPRVVRTQRRGLTTEDYEALIESIAGVKHCQTIDRNYGDQWPHMYIALFVVPEGGGPMSQEMQSLIYAQLATWGHLGAWETRYILRDAVEVPVDITCRIGVVTGHNENTVKAALTTALQGVFSLDNIGPGDSVSYSSLHTAALGVSGVSWVEIDAPTETTAAGVGELLVPGTISITAQ